MPLKNATFVTVPSASVAEAVRVIVLGWMKVELLVGTTQLITGGILVRSFALTSVELAPAPAGLNAATT